MASPAGEPGLSIAPMTPRMADWRKWSSAMASNAQSGARSNVSSVPCSPGSRYEKYPNAGIAVKSRRRTRHLREFPDAENLTVADWPTRSAPVRPCRYEGMPGRPLHRSSPAS